MKEKINALLKSFVENEVTNRVQGPEGPVAVFDEPIAAYTPADDPGFARLRHPGVVGEHAALPADFMPDARTVAAIFFPYSEPVKASNRMGADPSLLWLRASAQGKVVTSAVYKKLTQTLAREGIKVLDPTRGPAFKAIIGDGPDKGIAVGIPAAEKGLWADKKFTSNWSERHIAFVCGLGTFGISGGFITAKGAAGVLMTLLLNCQVETETGGGCGDPYGNCARCGACARRCPARAISMESGYSPAACLARENETGEKFAPLHGCGKCRVGVPCESSIPKG